MDNIRKDFPFIKNNPELAYFDNAATSLKPQEVIDEVVHYYEDLGANIHRGDYKKSLETSDLFDHARDNVAKFISAKPKEIVFTSGASESLNLVALGFAGINLVAGDVILLNETEHASNLLPWYALAKNKGFVIEFIEPDDRGDVDLVQLEKALHPKVKLVSIAHASNVLGYVRDIKSMAKSVHAVGAYIVVDGAQSIGHMPVDVSNMDVDFFAFSAHKMLGPTGVGILYGKYDLLQKTEPLLYGGGSNVDFDLLGDLKLKDAPYKFESGTPNIEGVLGTSKAIDYLMNLGMENVDKITNALYQYAYSKLSKLEHVIVYNPNSDIAVISFNVKGIFAQDVSRYLDSKNVAVRAGEHCAKVLDPTFTHEKTVRASLYIYNTKEEVDRFVDALETITLEQCIDLYI